MRLKVNMSPGVLKLIKILLILLISFSAKANPIEGTKVEIKILNKIAAKVKNIEINVNESFTHETLNIDIYACYKNPPEDIPEDFVLLKVDDNSDLKKSELIYQGWMISSSPVVTPFEHPIYDLWLVNCKTEIDF